MKRRVRAGGWQGLGRGAGDQAGVAAQNGSLKKDPKSILRMVFSGMQAVTPHPVLREIFINSILCVGGLHMDYACVQRAEKKLWWE